MRNLPVAGIKLSGLAAKEGNASVAEKHGGLEKAPGAENENG